jgi:hypothetical protein
VQPNELLQAYIGLQSKYQYSMSVLEAQKLIEATGSLSVGSADFRPFYSRIHFKRTV